MHLEMRGIEPRAFHMQSERSTTELHPLYVEIHLSHPFTPKKWTKNLAVPTGGLEPPIFGLGDRRLIH